MVDETALRAAVRDYARRIAGTFELGHALYSLTDHSLQILGCDGAGVSVGDTGGALRFVTASEQAVVRIEEEQSVTQQGPCFEAFETGELVVTSDLQDERRWDRYRTTALEAGFRAVCGIPMIIEEQRIGAMNLYLRRPHEWADDELDVARLLGDMASGYIANHRTLSESQQLAGQLQEALDSRVVIEQAKGVIAAHHDVTVSEAFDRLRAYARSRGEKLHRIARDVVDRQLRP